MVFSEFPLWVGTFKCCMELLYNRVGNTSSMLILLPKKHPQETWPHPSFICCKQCCYSVLIHPMFCCRSHLRDIRDRSVLRLFESADVGWGAMPPGIVPPQTWDQDQSYFSEPEFDSEYQHQHIHKTKVSAKRFLILLSYNWWQFLTKLPAIKKKKTV